MKLNWEDFDRGRASFVDVGSLGRFMLRKVRRKPVWTLKRNGVPVDALGGDITDAKRAADRIIAHAVLLAASVPDDTPTNISKRARGQASDSPAITKMLGGPEDGLTISGDNKGEPKG